MSRTTWMQVTWAALAALLFLTLMARPVRSAPPAPLQSTPQIRPSDPQRSSCLVMMGDKMQRRAEIRVIPLEQAIADRTELDALREQAANARERIARMEVADPALRQQIERQQQVMELLLRYAERQISSQGKSEIALDVEKRLNENEGRGDCMHCHGPMMDGDPGHVGM